MEGREGWETLPVVYPFSEGDGLSVTFDIFGATLGLGGQYMIIEGR